MYPVGTSNGNGFGVAYRYGAGDSYGDCQGGGYGYGNGKGYGAGFGYGSLTSFGDYGYCGYSDGFDTISTRTRRR